MEIIVISILGFLCLAYCVTHAHITITHEYKHEPIPDVRVDDPSYDAEGDLNKVEERTENLDALLEVVNGIMLGEEVDR